MGRLTDWVKAQKTGVVVSGLNERAKTSVTCRIDDLHLQMLGRLAGELGMTRTAYAEQILELAIQDAWTDWFGKEPTREEIMRMTIYWYRVEEARQLAAQQVNDEKAKKILTEAKVSEIMMFGKLHSVRLSIGGSNVTPASAPIIASFHESWLEGKDVETIAAEIQAALQQEIGAGHLPI